MIVWLGDNECHEVGRVGGKAANLSRLASLHRVPPGFALTPRFTLAVLREGEAPHRSQVAVAYQRLAAMVALDDVPVAVRSSAVDEDGGSASFAGQHETVLNVRGAASIMQAVMRCVTSSTDAGATAYRERIGLRAEGAGMAVLVQVLIPVEVSAVVFSANPISGNRREILINASWGLGESLVSGAVTPDTFVVDRSTWRVTSARAGDKALMTVSADHGTQQVAVPALRQTMLSLTAEQAIEAARVAEALERTMGWPVDIECGFHRGELHLFQCRPITTLR
jgi:phosphoenolpyruvate synthase/pyruvate phosphate dikinase